MSTTTETTDPTAEVPTLSAWQGAQRWALRAASRATASQRARAGMSATSAVLLYVLASTPPASSRPGQIAAHTGLSPQAVAEVIADLEDAGMVEAGSARTGRVGILVPGVLAALGLADYGISPDVRADVEPSGAHVEQTLEVLAEAFAGATT